MGCKRSQRQATVQVTHFLKTLAVQPLRGFKATISAAAYQDHWRSTRL